LSFIRSILGTVGGFFSNWQACLVALALGTAGGGFLVYKVMHNANEAAITQQAKATVAYVVRANGINTNLGTLYVPQYVFIQGNTARIQQEIPQHVTPQIDRTYHVPLGFVRVFNDASHGPVPGPAAGSDADPSGVPISDVARAHAADEGTLDVCRKELSEWWDWYDQQSALWNKTGNAVSK
jgi:hypothetical protein